MKRPEPEPRHPAGRSLAARTVSGFKWAVFTAGGQAVLSLAIAMVLSRLLEPEDFGQFAIALIFLNLAGTAGRQSFGPALIQRFELTERHVATGFTVSLAIGALLAAALYWLAPLVGSLAGEPQVAPILRVLALAAFLAGPGVVSEHLLRRDLRFRQLMGAAILSQAIGNGLVAIAMAMLGFEVWALVWAVIARQAVFTLVVIACRPPPGLLFARRETGELLRTGTGFSFIAFFNVISEQGVHFVVGRTLGAASLGFYTRAFRLALVPASLSPALGNVLLPAMARRQYRTERLETVHLNGVEMLLLAAVPASLAIAVIAPEVVAIVLGPQWDAAVPALQILALTGAAPTCNALHVSAIRAIGAVYRETWRRALFFVLLIAGTWLGSRWGLAGVAAAVAGAGIVLHLLLTHLALSLLRLSWRPLLARHLPGLWAALWATPAVWLTAGFLRETPLPVLAILPLALAAWAATAAAAIYWAPPFARPAFPHWGLTRLPLTEMGRTGRWLEAVLAHLARRWPAPPSLHPPGDAAGTATPPPGTRSSRAVGTDQRHP